MGRWFEPNSGSQNFDALKLLLQGVFVFALMSASRPKLPVNSFLTAKDLRRELQTQQREHIALLFRSCTHNPSIGILSAFR